jgi:hypothetical protein
VVLRQLATELGVAVVPAVLAIDAVAMIRMRM